MDDDYGDEVRAGAARVRARPPVTPPARALAQGLSDEGKCSIGLDDLSDDAAQPAEKKQRHAPSAEGGEDDQARTRANRDRNREHARNTRLRKKAYVENLKRTVQELSAQVCVKAAGSRAPRDKGEARKRARAHPRCGARNPLARAGRARRRESRAGRGAARATRPTLRRVGLTARAPPRPRSSASIATGARRRPSPTSEPGCANRCCRRSSSTARSASSTAASGSSCSTSRARSPRPSRRTARTRPRRSSTTSASSSASTA